MIIRDIKDVKNVVQDLILLREKSYSKHITKPSKIWSVWLDMLKFPMDFSNDNLHKIRLHTGFGFFLGSNWSSCYYEKNEIDIGLKNIKDSQYIKDYDSLTKNIESEFFCTEIDKNRELISIKYNEKYINEDLLRCQSTISNLSNLKDKKIRKYLEIGAGYGGLCNQFNQIFKPEQSIIVDQPEVLFWSIIYTYINNPNATIEIITDINSQVGDADFVFIPAFLVDVLKDYNVDLVVNENSFSEMTEEQVNYYMDILSYDLMYSNNRNRQFMNFEVTDLNEIILNKFKTKPEMSFYKNYYNNDSSVHNHKFHFFASKELSNLPIFEDINLCGLSIRIKH